MKIVIRIFLVILILIVIAAAAGLAVASYWARAGRLSPAESTELLKQAWEISKTEIPAGQREIFYDFDGEVFRYRPEEGKLRPFNKLMASLFPQVGLTEEFLTQLEINHAGRSRVAGRTCEKILISPVHYDGNSLELWIEPDGYHVLGYRTLDYQGKLVRGFRFVNITGVEAVAEQDIPEDLNLPFIQERALVPPDTVETMAGRNVILLPDWLPPGFKLTGGRYILNFDQPAFGEDLMPEMGIGRLLDERAGDRPGEGRFEPGQPREGGNQFQTIYSDGLNTISVIQLPPGKVIEAAPDPGRLEHILRAKSDEVWRLFHTGMVGRFFPNAVVIVYGEVSPDIAREIAASISYEPPPADEDGSGPQPPRGFDRPHPDRPFGGGPGRGRLDGETPDSPRGPGSGPE